jgi:hypothetical protein
MAGIFYCGDFSAGLVLKKKGKAKFMAELWEPMAENILDRLSELENYPHEALAPYEEFRVGANTYYFTPGGFLYRKDPGSEEAGGSFCGHLTEEAWHHRTDDG